MKLFKRIQNKLLAAFLIVVLLPLIGTGLYGNWITSKVLQDNALDNAKHETNQQAGQINDSLDNAKSNVLFLSELSSLRALIEARAHNNPADASYWQEQINKDLSAFSRRCGICYQARYISEDGWEIIRVDSDGYLPKIIPEDELQDKSSRYYFQETMKLGKGEVFVSPMDLNREYGEIEVPHQPVIRYATPVFDEAGNRRGIVVSNIFGDKILNPVRQTNSNKAKTLLVDQDGYYLVNPNTNHEWGGPSDLNTGYRLQYDYPPDATPKILSGQPGDMVGATVLVYTPIYPDPVNRSIYWVVVHDEPSGVIFASVWQFRTAAITILILAAVIAAAIALRLARDLTAPIRDLRKGVERFGRGQLTKPVLVSTNDEIGQLAEAFNEMAATIDLYSRQRRNLLERLINVQEEERRMIAYDLHDGLIQRLVGARLQLSNFSRQRDGDCQKAENSFRRAAEHLSDAIIEGRHIIEGLRPALLDDLGLVPALQELADKVAEEMRCALTFNANLNSERLTAAVEITAFRIVQEALNNSRKYSEARQLQITITRQNNQLEIIVQDRGIGFDITCINQDHRCVGLTGMQERAKVLGGECYVESTPGQGTVVKAILPVK